MHGGGGGSKLGAAMQAVPVGGLPQGTPLSLFVHTGTFPTCSILKVPSSLKRRRLSRRPLPFPPDGPLPPPASAASASAPGLCRAALGVASATSSATSARKVKRGGRRSISRPARLVGFVVSRVLPPRRVEKAAVLIAWRGRRWACDRGAQGPDIQCQGFTAGQAACMSPPDPTRRLSSTKTSDDFHGLVQAASALPTEQATFRSGALSLGTDQEAAARLLRASQST